MFKVRYKLRKMFGPFTKIWGLLTLRLNEKKDISCLMEGTGLTVIFKVQEDYYKWGKLKRIVLKSDTNAGEVAKALKRATTTERALEIMGSALKSKIIQSSSWGKEDEIEIDIRHKTFTLTLRS